MHERAARLIQFILVLALTGKIVMTPVAPAASFLSLQPMATSALSQRLLAFNANPDLRKKPVAITLGTLAKQELPAWHTEFERLYTPELHSLGVTPETQRQIVPDFQMASAGLPLSFGLYDEDLQAAAMKMDVRQLIRAKEDRGDRRFLTIGVGLGGTPAEALDFVKMIDGIIAEESQVPDQWEIRFFGVDVDVDRIRLANEGAFNLISRGEARRIDPWFKYRGHSETLHVRDVLMRAFLGNATDRFALEDLLRGDFLQAENEHRYYRRKTPQTAFSVDYITHRNVTYVNDSAARENGEFSRDLRSFTKKQWLTYLNAFMQYRAIILAFGKPGVRYVVDAVNLLGTATGSGFVFTPPDAVALTVEDVLGETWRLRHSIARGSLNDRGIGLLEVNDLNIIRKMSLQQFHQFVRNSRLAESV